MTVQEIPIDVIGLSARSMNALHRIGVHTVGEMLQYDEAKLYQIRNLGQKSVREILAKIAAYQAMALSGDVPAEPPEPDVQTWLASDSGKSEMLQWLRDKRVRIDVLELLSAKAYNLLTLHGYEYLHQLAFQTEEDLLKIPRMDEACACEIRKWTEDYLLEHGNEILLNLRVRETAVTLEQMRLMPEYQSSILAYGKENDISVDSLPISVRAKNALQRNGYHNLSDILILTREQLKRIPSMGAGSTEQILEQIRAYLRSHEARILAFCNGDTSVLLDDTALRKKILRLYQDAPFQGFSLTEMEEKMNLPEDYPQKALKKVIGSLLAERKLEYVDFRCYRVYERFETFLPTCDAIDPRSVQILQKRLCGRTLDEIGQEYGITRERVRQIIGKRVGNVRNQYALRTGDHWFDEDYYWYFYENYAFDKREASAWMGIPESVWKYLEMMDVKQGKKELDAALDDAGNLEIGLRLKIKNYLNRNKIFVDGIWVEKNRTALEPVIARKFCQEDMPFDTFAKTFNAFLQSEEIPYDEDLYYTDAIIRTRKNQLAKSRFILWKQNELIRYYDIDGRDYTELLDALQLDTYENVEYSTLKFFREYPLLMEKYDIRDQYELHNLLRKIVPEGSYHNFHCGRMPEIKFGNFDRDAAILDLLVDMTPVSAQALSARIADEYGFDPAVILANYLQPFSIYYHNGVYSIGQKPMAPDRAEALHRMLPDDFYYLDEIRKTYHSLYPDADLEEINPYNLKSMGFIVLSRYVVQHYPSLEAYCEDILTREDIVNLKPLRKRMTYVQMFSQKLMELKRNLEVIEFEPEQILNFRRLAQAGVTREDIRHYCDAVSQFVPDGSYFSAQSLKADGFASVLHDLGFSDWFYANLLLSDDRFSFTYAFKNMILYKGKADITMQSFLVDCICAHGWVDTYDLMTELTDRYGCTVDDKWDITYRLKNTQVYHDRVLDRLYANADLYYRDLDAEGGC